MSQVSQEVYSLCFMCSVRWHAGGSSFGPGAGFIRAYVSDHIHPETVFKLHGFGHEAQLATRCLEASCRPTSRIRSAAARRSMIPS